MASHNALVCPDEPTPLFPDGHPLRRLALPSFDSIRRVLRGIAVSTLWIDGASDPERAGFRPSYDSIHGPGSASVMAFVASWLSTGPGSERDGGNVVFFPDDLDPSLVDYAQRVGLLGAHERVRDIPALRRRVAERGLRLYNIDDLGDAFDPWAVVPAGLARWVSSKDALRSLTRFGPPEAVVDMHQASLADFEAARAHGGRVFLKTCNTESAGMGVFIARSPDEFSAHLAAIREKQARHGLNRSLVIQPEIVGRNCSFQVLLDPSRPDVVQVIALTDQLVEDDGKTYRSSINHAITPANVEPVGAAILDLVDHVRARDPGAFGFLMSDYFATERGPVVYDPGLRPTGNTATALAAHLARKLTGRFMTSSLVPLPTGRPGLTFADFARRAGPLVDPDNLRREGRALLPWGWNPIQGFGMIIAVAHDAAALDALRAELLSLRHE